MYDIRGINYTEEDTMNDDRNTPKDIQALFELNKHSAQRDLSLRLFSIADWKVRDKITNNCWHVLIG